MSSWDTVNEKVLALQVRMSSEASPPCSPTPSPRVHTHNGSFDILETLFDMAHVRGNQTSPETSGVHWAQEEHCAQEPEGNMLGLHVLQEGWKSAASQDWRAVKETPDWIPLYTSQGGPGGSQENRLNASACGVQGHVSPPLVFLNQLNDPSPSPQAPTSTPGSAI